MTKLIIALAAAHRALLEAPADPNGDFAPTARKIETTLLGCVDALAPGGLTAQAVVALLNSGSLKAVKRAPLADKALRGGYNMPGPEPTFIFAQGPAYVKEALKRGFGLDARDRTRMLEEAATAGAAIAHPGLVLDGDVDSVLLDQVMAIALRKGPIAPIADVVAKLLDKGVKANTDRVAAKAARLCVVHDPALAGELWTKAMTAYALLGVKAPAKDAFEHAEVAKAVGALFAPANRKALKAQWPTLAAWLVAGAPPATELAPIDRARAGYRTQARSRW